MLLDKCSSKPKLGRAMRAAPGAKDYFAYVAVYVVALDGAVTSWVCAPPSDQETQLHLPRSRWGDGALSVFLEPTIAVRLNGVGPAALLSPA